MSTRSTSAALASLVLCLAACEEALPPGTSFAPTPPTAGPNEAMVTFIRPSTPCDAGEYAVVVDDRGRFVGNVAVGTQVSLPTTPGVHVYYAWSNVEFVVASDPNFDPVAAVRIDARAGDPNYVVIDARKPCGARHLMEINFVRALRDPAAGDAEARKIAAETKPVVVDRVIGQQALDAHPNRLRYQMELGRMALRRRDLAKTAEVQRAALARGGDSTASENDE